MTSVRRFDIETITVDPAYAEAAARRTASGAPAAGRRGVRFLVGLVVAGLVVGVAARQQRLRAPAAARLRAALVTEVEQRTAITDRLRAEQERLRIDTAAARDRALRTSSSGESLAQRLADLELAAAGIAVVGRGLEVRLDDAPPGSSSPNSDDGRIRDRDLQDVVNALWAAGAEAIAVNGQRVGPLTAIREAGEAILVDYRPLSPPYLVAAVADPDVAEPAFTDSPTARRFRTWEEVYGLSFDVRRRDRLTLPAAETTRLRHAVPVAALPPVPSAAASPGRRR